MGGHLISQHVQIISHFIFLFIYSSNGQNCMQILVAMIGVHQDYLYCFEIDVDIHIKVSRRFSGPPNNLLNFTLHRQDVKPII